MLSFMSLDVMVFFLDPSVKNIFRCVAAKLPTGSFLLRRSLVQLRWYSNQLLKYKYHLQHTRGKMLQTIA